MSKLAPRWIAAFALLCTFSLVVGCGGSKGDITGKVSYKGKALPYGSIQFISPAGAKVADIGSDGAYSISGVPAGTSKVSITCQDPKYADFMKHDASSKKDALAGKKVAPNPFGKSAEDFNLIPGKYMDPEGSGLTFEVKSGKQTWDIDLK